MADIYDWVRIPALSRSALGVRWPGLEFDVLAIVNRVVSLAREPGAVQA